METTLIDDPRLTRLAQALNSRPAARIRRAPDAAEAAVAMLLRPRTHVELLLIKRARHDADPWSGHIALPGGRREPEDSDLQGTAFRETAEETNIAVARIGRLLGSLDEVQPSTPALPPIVIAPFVVGVPANTSASPCPSEVDDAMWVPLPALRSPEAASRISIRTISGPESFPALEYRGFVIWGLTHRILTQFLPLAETCGC